MSLTFEIVLEICEFVLEIKFEEKMSFWLLKRSKKKLIKKI